MGRSAAPAARAAGRPSHSPRLSHHDGSPAGSPASERMRGIRPRIREVSTRAPLPISEPPGQLWIVSAPSGGGKTSLTRAVIASLQQRGIGAVISVSYTTRTPRPGEEEGLHYHFVDDRQFD